MQTQSRHFAQSTFAGESSEPKASPPLEARLGSPATIAERRLTACRTRLREEFAARSLSLTPAPRALCGLGWTPRCDAGRGRGGQTVADETSPDSGHMRLMLRDIMAGLTVEAHLVTYPQFDTPEFREMWDRFTASVQETRALGLMPIAPLETEGL